MWTILAALIASTALGDEPAPVPAISHGPILGRPGAHRMGVWARTNRPGGFRVRYGRSADELELVSDTIATRPGVDNTGWVLLEGLDADAEYHYRVVPDGGPEGPGGSFRTLPDPDEVRDPEHNPKGLFNFRFEVGSCNDQRENSLGPSLPTYRTMLDRGVPDRVHFAILNGDWLYEEGRETTPEDWAVKAGLEAGERPGPVGVAPTIVGVWENYRRFLEHGAPMAAWQRVVPSYFTFDDHEILNDVIGCGEVGLRSRRAVFRDIALQAWTDYLGWADPIPPEPAIRFGRAELRAGSDVLTDPKADFRAIDPKGSATLHVHWGTPDAGVDDPRLDAEGGDPNAGVYEIVEVLGAHRLRIRPAAKADGPAAYSVGRPGYFRERVANCDFFVLDTRTFRERHDLAHRDKPGLSMLGRRQVDWLAEEMPASDADFLFVVSSVPLTIPHVDSGGMAFAAEDKDDSWTAFLDERERLIRLWSGLGRPVIVLTGDLHNSFAVRVADGVHEFACGPHNSGNHPAKAEGGRPPVGPFDSFGRAVDIRWSTYFLDDVPKELRRRPVYALVQVNNAFPNPKAPGQPRWVAYPRPQVVVQYHDGLTGELLYAEAIAAGD